MIKEIEQAEARGRAAAYNDAAKRALGVAEALLVIWMNGCHGYAIALANDFLDLAERANKESE